MKHANKILVVSFIFLIAGTSFGFTNLYPTKYQGLSELLLTSLEKWHFSGQEIDDNLSIKSFDNYINQLDPNKQFFLTSDITELNRHRLDIDDQLRQGSKSLVIQSNNILKKRITQVKDHAKTVLAKPFNYTKNETLMTDVDLRKRPDTTAELQSLWRQQLKYQTVTTYFNIYKTEHPSENIANIEIDAKLEKKARKQVSKTVNQMLERLLKRTKEDEYTTLFNAVAQSFDPHTVYLPPRKKQDFDIGLTGRLEGIGAVLREQDGYIKVVSIVPGSAAWHQKELKPEDIILKVKNPNKEPVPLTGMRVEDAVTHIRGKKGTEVRLTVQHPNGTQVEIPIIRDVVIIEETFAKSSVIQNTKTNRKIGYIYLPGFYRDFKDDNARNSTTDIAKEIDRLKTENVEGIILDLRNNGGGALEDAVNIGGLFIPTGPIVQVKRKVGLPKVFQDKNPEVNYKGPLVVLINRFSASASEILAGALQDYNRAVIIGTESSYGKGTVQTLVDLDPHVTHYLNHLKPLGSLKLTIQKFYRVNGESTQFKGIVPDIILPDSLAYTETGEKKLKNSLPWSKIEPLIHSNLQLSQRDISTLKTESQLRVDNNEYFSLVNKYVTAMKVRRDINKEFPLKIDTAWQTVRSQEKETEMYTPKPDPFKHLLISLPNSVEKDISSDKDKLAKKTEWLKQLQKDYVLEEATSIISDLISLAAEKKSVSYQGR